MKKGMTTILIICSILLIGLTSAGLIDSIKGTLTGKATSQPTNVTITVTGTSQADIISISQPLNINPTENAVTYVSFSAIMCDNDGVSDLNDTSVQANFTRIGEIVRLNSTCTQSGADLNTTCANYSCQIDMWYFDGAGEWNITVTGNDLGNLTPALYNDQNTSNFTYTQLKAMILPSDAVLIWNSVVPGNLNQTADNDPTLINNTGNYDGELTLSGLDLYGETITSELFDVTNFTTGINSTGANPECLGTGLVNGSAQTIGGSTANKGNLSAGAGAGQENLYYCIPQAPLVSSQQYTTNYSTIGGWTVGY